MGKIAKEAELVLRECSKETDGYILTNPRKSVDFQKRFWANDATVLRNRTSVMREFYIESDWQGLVNLVMKMTDKPDGRIRLATFDISCLTYEATAKAIEAIVKTQF